MQSGAQRAGTVVSAPRRVASRNKRIGWHQGLVVLAASLGLCLGLGELAVRAFVAVPNVGPAFTIYDPVYGKRLRPSFTATRATPEFRFTIHTNSMGMRGPEPPRPIRDAVLFMGDSFTMGYGVEQGESFPARIRTRLHARGVRVPVLNAGMGDAGNGHWVKRLEREAERWSPQLVVLQVMANDFGDNLRDGLFELGQRGRLRELPVPPPSFGRSAQGWIEAIPGLTYSHLIGLGWAAISYSRAPVDTPAARAALAGRAQPTDGLTHALVKRAIVRSRALGADVVTLLVGIEGERRAALLRQLRAAHVPVLEAPSKAAAPEMYYEVDGHWNRVGHAVVADQLWPHIAERLSAAASQ